MSLSDLLAVCWAFSLLAGGAHVFTVLPVLAVCPAGLSVRRVGRLCGPLVLCLFSLPLAVSLCGLCPLLAVVPSVRALLAVSVVLSAVGLGCLCGGSGVPGGRLAGHRMYGKMHKNRLADLYTFKV